MALMTRDNRPDVRDHESAYQDIPASTVGVNFQGNMGGPAGVWGFAIVWNCFVGFVYFCIHDLAKPPLGWFFCLFGGVGVLMVCTAVYMTITRLRYGRTVFEIQRFAAVPGGVVTGVIRLPRPFVYHSAIHLRLACVRGVVQKLAAGRAVQEESVLWEGRCVLDRYTPGVIVEKIPVFFRLPPSAIPSDILQTAQPVWWKLEALPKAGVLWKLDAKAKAESLPFFSSFVVPVLAGRPSQTFENLPDPTSSLRSPQLARRQPADRHIHVTALPGGGCRCEFAPGRNVLAALILMAIGLFFLGGGLLLVTLNGEHSILAVIPISVGTLCAAIGTVPTFLAIYFLLERITVTIEHGSLSIERGMGAVKRKKTYPVTEIRDVTMAIGGQINDKPLYAINAIRPEQKPVEIVGMMRDKQDAECLTAEFRNDLFGTRDRATLAGSPVET